jgi:hypothetical protein
MLWDDHFFYVAADIREPHVWATLKEHDSVIFRDSDFEVFIDPNGDNHEYYEFEINALGTFWDLLLPKPYKDDGKPVNAWEIPGLKSAVRVSGTLNDPSNVDRGWTVELAFPWSVLGELARRQSPPKNGDQWRVNFSRVEWHVAAVDGAYVKAAKTPEDNWVWSPQYVIDMHRPETWGYVQFSTDTTHKTAFVPDWSWPARQWLMRVYYAEREYQKTYGRFAGSFSVLGGTLATADPGLENPAVQIAGGSFEASVDIKGPQGMARFMIRQDSLIRQVMR